MNDNEVQDSGRIWDKDIEPLYRIVSDCIQMSLSQESDELILEYSKERSHNANEGMLLECTVNGIHRAGIKRCMDNSEYLRREVIIDQAKKALGFPSYTILKCRGIRLYLGDVTEKKPLTEWQDKEVLFIDFGKTGDFESLEALDPNQIDFADFSHQFGQWTAFNYLLEVLDRFGRNYLYSMSSRKIHSIDNELCRYRKKNVLGYSKVFNPPKQAIRRFLNNNQPADHSFLEKGFLDGWSRVADNLVKLDMFDKDEHNRITQRVGRSKPEQLISKFF